MNGKKFDLNPHTPRRNENESETGCSGSIKNKNPGKPGDKNDYLGLARLINLLYPTCGRVGAVGNNPYGDYGWRCLHFTDHKTTCT